MKTDHDRYQGALVPVAGDGYVYIVAGAFLSIASVILGLTILSVFFIVITIFTVWFFRDPERNSPVGEGILLSPADGSVICIEECENDPDIGRGTVVSIFMSVFNVHINRCPVSGVVSSINYHRGRFLAAFKAEAKEENERNEVVFKGAGGNVKSVQIAGLIARRIVCRLKESETVKVGQRYGLIKFGSRVDVYIPSSYELAVSEGDSVKGALTVIARLKEVQK